MDRFSTAIRQVNELRMQLERVLHGWVEVRHADELQQHRAVLLNQSLLMMAALIILRWVVDLGWMLLGRRPSLNPLVAVLLLGILGIAFAFNRGGRLRFAANFLAVMLVLLISLNIPIGGLVPAYLLYVIPCLLIAFAQPPALAFFYAGLEVLASAVMVLLARGSLHQLDFPAPVLIGAALVVWLGASRWEASQKAVIEERRQLSLAFDRAIAGWSRSIELADREVAGHTRRVTDLALAIGRQMGLPAAQLEDLRRGAMLHDIGKMNIPEHILMKSGALDEDETAAMQRHPVYAYEMLRDIPFLKPAVDIALYHHEAWDGSGYPSGLKGEQIPRLARIFSVADVWDSLSTDRAYRLGWLKPQIKAYLLAEAGRHFDPTVVEALTHLEIWQSRN